MFCSLDELVARIADGASVALAPDYSGCAMAAVRGLLTRRARDLHLIGVPQIGFQADMLIGAGCVAQVHSAAVTLGEYGLAPRFTNAIKNGTIEIVDSTCPAIHASLQASEKGLPVVTTPAPDAATRELIRGPVASAIAEVYPDFTARVFAHACAA